MLRSVWKLTAKCVNLSFMKLRKEASRSSIANRMCSMLTVGLSFERGCDDQQTTMDPSLEAKDAEIGYRASC